MTNAITCSVEEAISLLSHMQKDSMVTLTVLNMKTLNHNINRRIKKTEGEQLIMKADMIKYQDNDFFGRISLSGVVKDKNVIHNILFPQLE